MYRIPRDGEIDIMRWKRDTGIQYRHDKKRKMLWDSSQNRWHDLNMEQYISIKVCYCKIYIADTYT